MYYYLFKCFEVSAFIFPALPNNFYIRLFILGTYAYLHVAGYQHSYLSFKNKSLNEN